MSSDPRDSSASQPPECAGRDDLRRLDGQRVWLAGRYVRVTISQRPSAPPPGGTPGPACVQLDDGTQIMLGIYYQPGGRRDITEVHRLHGKRVRAVGVLHARTPDQYSDTGIIMATMTSPYLAVEAIDLA